MLITVTPSQRKAAVVARIEAARKRLEIKFASDWSVNWFCIELLNKRPYRVYLNVADGDLGIAYLRKNISTPSDGEASKRRIRRLERVANIMEVELGDFATLEAAQLAAEAALNNNNEEETDKSDQQTAEMAAGKVHN